jgi:hypothetical protein
MIGFIAAFALGTSAAFAQGTPAPAGSPVPSPAATAGKPGAPTPAPSPAASPAPAATTAPKAVQFNGVIDAIYNKTLSSGGLQFTGTPPASALSNFAFGPSNARWFDYSGNNLNLTDLNASATLNWHNWGGRILMNFGPQANISYTYPSQFNSIDLSQVYLNYTYGKFTAQGGKYATLAGYESSESVNDTTVSRGILFWYQPATHLGGRLTYAPNSKISLIAGINDGWNSWINTAGAMTAEYGISLNPNQTFSLAAQGYTGYAQIFNYNGLRPGTANAQFPSGLPGGPPTTAQGQKRLIDLVGTVHATKALTLVANYDSGSQSCTTPSGPTTIPDCTSTNWGGFAAPGTGSPVGRSVALWSGLAVYGIYQINPNLVGTVRYEGFHDANGFNTGYRQLWHEGTVALSYSLTPQVTLRTEYRHDVSDQPIFAVPANVVTTSGGTYAIGNGGVDRGNSTFEFEALAHF